MAKADNSSEARITIRIDKELNERAQFKCKTLFGIGLSTLMKLFLKSFVSQKNVGFYVGDDAFNDSLNRELNRRKMKQLMRERRALIRAGHPSE